MGSLRQERAADGCGSGIPAGTLLFAVFLTPSSIATVPLASSLVYNARPQKFEVIGIQIASFGTAMMTLPSGKIEMSSGDFPILLCVVTFALHIVSIGRFSPMAGLETMAAVQIAVAVFGFGLALLPGQSRVHAVPAPGAASIFALEPAAVRFTSYVAAGEVLSNRGKMGVRSIFAGVLPVEWKPGNPEKLNI